MDLLRRKLLGDRITWLLVAAATGVVVSQYVARGGQVRLYVLVVWAVAVVLLLAVSELRIGRRQPKPKPGALYAGTASYLGEEHVEVDGSRRVGWRGAVPGVMELGGQGIHWWPRAEQADANEFRVAWRQLHGWRLRGVLPTVWRASGYLAVTTTEGKDVVFHIGGQRRWRRALREAAIIGPTLAPPAWLPDEPAPEFGELLTDAIARAAAEAVSAEPAREPVAVSAIDRARLDRVEQPAVVETKAAEPVAVTASPAPPVGPGPTAPADAPEPVVQPVVAEPEPEERELEPVIGLECHVELSTESKVFCSCPTSFGADPNTQVCPVCTGQPGTLPVLNERAVELAMKIGLALNCRIAPRSVFHRKNYFYPDMPKNYQISQYDMPLATEGFLDVEVDAERSRIRIHRVHLEEDTGKTTHVGGTGRIGEGEYAKVDYNRAGVPLVEVVSEPDIRSPAQARAYLSELRSLLLWLGVSDVRMEEGSLRCDANVSVRRAGSSELGVKTEVKNMNSMRSVQRALEYEIDRLGELVRTGQAIPQETRHFDEGTGRTISGRSKEYSSDYRYLPDPDLVPLEPSQDWIERVRASIPELPAERRRRFADGYGLADVAARTLTSSLGLANAFEEAVKVYADGAGGSKAIARWYTGELAGIANERGVEPHEAGVAPKQVAELQRLVDEGTVSDSQAKTTVIRAVAESGKDPSVVVREQELTQISDTSELDAVVDRVIAANPDVVAKIKAGKESAIQALKGQVMRETRGRADPRSLDALIKQRIDAS